MSASREVRRLGPEDLGLLNDVLATFGQAFDDPVAFTGRRPSDDYLRRLLGGDWFIALAALEHGRVVGGLAAYELHKIEQERSEIYVYDLAVTASHRRRGVATALLEHLREIAARRGACLIFVQADTDREDEPAIALYSRLGRRREVLHFEIAVDRSGDAGG